MLLKNPIDFTLGVDAEFLVLDKNRLICHNDTKGEWGCDGSGFHKVTEIRSKPFTNPLKIVNNIREIFTNKIKIHPDFLNYKWLAGSFIRNRPIGFHLHFGVNKKIIHPSVAIHHLEQYIGSIGVLLERKGEGLKRRKNYGFYGDYREQPWGFEQRSFGSCLSSPHATTGILCLGKTVMYELINNKSFKWGTYITSDNFSHMETKKVRSKFASIWADIQKMTLYPKYKKQIDFLKFLVDNNLTWHTKRDIKQSWGIIKIPIESKSNKQKKTFLDFWSKFKAVPIVPSSVDMNFELSEPINYGH